MKNTVPDSNSMEFLERRPHEENNKSFSFRKSAKALWQYSKGVYLPKHRQYTDKTLKSILRYRAWLIHCLYTLLRLYNWGQKESIWLSEKQSCFNEEGEIGNKEDCLAIHFSNDAVNDLRPTVRYVCVSLIIFSAVLDVAIFKWRWLTSLLIFEGCIY